MMKYVMNVIKKVVHPSSKSLLTCDKLTKVLSEEHEGEDEVDKINYYTKLVTGEVVKRYGISIDQEKGGARFRNVYKVENIGSQSN